MQVKLIKSSFLLLILGLLVQLGQSLPNVPPSDKNKVGFVDKFKQCFGVRCNSTKKPNELETIEVVGTPTSPRHRSMLHRFHNDDRTAPTRYEEDKWFTTNPYQNHGA